MISRQAVDEQLKRIGCNFRFWGRSEVNELGRILMDDEIIAQCVNGEYSNGFAMLVATNHRLLLVDKKPLLYLTVEDLRFDMITEFNFNHRMMNATINLYTANKTLTFTSWNQHRLRKLMEYVQARVLEMRQQQHMASQFTAAAAAQYVHMQTTMNQQPTSPPQILATPQLANPSAQQTQQAEPNTNNPDLSPQQKLANRLANGRAALGTYTRSKLPQFRRHQQSNTSPEAGDVMPDGYSNSQYTVDI